MQMPGSGRNDQTTRNDFAAPPFLPSSPHPQSLPSSFLLFSFSPVLLPLY